MRNLPSPHELRPSPQLAAPDVRRDPRDRVKDDDEVGAAVGLDELRAAVEVEGGAAQDAGRRAPEIVVQPRPRPLAFAIAAPEDPARVEEVGEADVGAHSRTPNAHPSPTPNHLQPPWRAGVLPHQSGICLAVLAEHVVCARHRVWTSSKARPHACASP